MLEYFWAFVGGALIGIAALLLLLLNGRILGVSGILGGMLQPYKKGESWRYFFLLGMGLGGLVILALHPTAFEISVFRTPGAIILAGLLVGFGTRLGSGCTSGHGVCGVSRLSPRSIVATITFIAFGAATVFVITHWLGGRV